MPRRILREALTLLAVSVFLALSFNAVTGKGIFDPGAAGQTGAQTDRPLPSSEVISVEQARSLFDDGAALFIDTRHAYDYTIGHIAGAVNVPLKDAGVMIPRLAAAKDRTLVVYCDGAECNSSLEVSASLIMAGYTDVRIFFSGWQAWKDMGYPTEGTPE